MAVIEYRITRESLQMKGLEKKWNSQEIGIGCGL